MTKRDNELTRLELIEKRAHQLLKEFDMHRGQLPEPLIFACTGLRDAVNKPSDEDAVTLKADRDRKLAVDTSRDPRGAPTPPYAPNDPYGSAQAQPGPRMPARAAAINPPASPYLSPDEIREQADARYRSENEINNPKPTAG